MLVGFIHPIYRNGNKTINYYYKNENKKLKLIGEPVRTRFFGFVSETKISPVTPNQQKQLNFSFVYKNCSAESSAMTNKCRVNVACC